MPGATVALVAREGDRLSELHDQDAYSTKLAEVHLSAPDHDELLARWEACVDALAFEVDGVPATIGAGEGA